MAAKKKTKLIRLVSKETGYFKTYKKSGTTEKKLELKKYDPVLRKRVVFKENTKFK